MERAAPVRGGRPSRAALARTMAECTKPSAFIEIVMPSGALAYVPRETWGGFVLHWLNAGFAVIDGTRILVVEPVANEWLLAGDGLVLRHWVPAVVGVCGVEWGHA